MKKFLKSFLSWKCLTAGIAGGILSAMGIGLDTYKFWVILLLIIAYGVAADIDAGRHKKCTTS